MKRSKKLVRIHSLLILLLNIICITGAIFLYFDKCVVAYVCLFICIMIFPCLGALNFEYRLSLLEEDVNEIKNKGQKEQSYETQN